MKLTRKQKGELVTQYTPLAYRHAAKFAATYKIPFNDVADEAISGLGLIAMAWNESGDPSCSPDGRTTWVYQKLYWHLLTFCTRKQPRERCFTSVTKDEDVQIDAPAKTGWFEGLLHTLGDDARDIVEIIVNAPAELAEEIRPRKPAKTAKAIQNYVERYFDWEPTRVMNAWAEVEAAL